MSEKPTPPADNECCESGCTPCVWDTYYEEVSEWQQAEADAKKRAETEEAENPS